MSLWVNLSSTQAQSTIAPRQFTLQQVFQQADLHSPQLIAAQRSLNIAQAGITIAGVTPNPQLGVQYGFGSVYTEGGNPQQVGVTQTIELGGKRPARLSLAEAQYRLTALQFNALRFVIHAQVRRAYAQLTTAEANLKAVEAQTALVDKFLFIATKRFQAGVSPGAEVIQAQLTRDQVETGRVVGLSRIEQARYALNGLLGYAPDESLEPADKSIFQLSVEKTELVPALNVSFPAVETLVAQALTNRFDLLINQQQRLTAQAQLNLAQTQRIPDLQVTGASTFTTLTNGNPQLTGVLAGIGVNIPIFYNQQGEIAQAEATVQQAALQETAVRAQIVVDVKTAYRALEAGRETIRRYQTNLLPASAEVVRLAQESYQVGKTGLAAAILAQQANQQVRSGYLDAVTAYQGAYADLEQAIGAPF